MLEMTKLLIVINSKWIIVVNFFLYIFCHRLSLKQVGECMKKVINHNEIYYKEPRKVCKSTVPFSKLSVTSGTFRWSEKLNELNLQHVPLVTLLWMELYSNMK